MASIFIGGMASQFLGASLGTMGASGGYLLGSMLGGAIDNRIFNHNIKSKSQGHRLQNLMVQSSTYGRCIPVVYGSVRLAGNVIWAKPINEIVETHSQSARVGKVGGRKVTNSYSEYKYYATFAIGICEGVIDSISNIWADAKLLKIQDYNIRIYKGTEDQVPDSIIQSFEGINKTPAYRGLVYAVFENFPLAEFGNRIPNFTFEVNKKPRIEIEGYEDIEELIDAMVIIPGSGEFVYETKPIYKTSGIYVNNELIQKGKREVLNINNHENIPDAKLSINQLEESCPNLKWVSLTSCWFSNSLEISSSNIKPGVESDKIINVPYEWNVGSFTRKNAHKISIDEENFVRFGGTPSDESILSFIEELRLRNKKVMFYPLLMVDLPGKPWRGWLTGNYNEVGEFFNGDFGYNKFILHYAKLLKGKIDAFIIGSELKNITKIKNDENEFVAVNELINLAKEVKQILGDAVKVTYAADWSEYHHTDNGYFHLDELWASEYIDMIGVDAYFPLTDTYIPEYDLPNLLEGFESGELYDYYLEDGGKKPLHPSYAIKNIKYWWENFHFNPNGEKTKWQPKMKKIWFTEYGFPSVDQAFSQPNVFYDPNSLDGGLPKFSKGNIDFYAQRMGILAYQKYFANSEFLEEKFLWCYDARPYPYWPNYEHLWRDGKYWITGHWVNGKLGKASLASVIASLCLKSGLTLNQIDVSKLNQVVEGFIISDNLSVKEAIQILSAAYFFDIIESENIIKFIPKSAFKVTEINYGDLIFSDTESPVFTIIRSPGNELPSKFEVNYLDKNFGYQNNIKIANRAVSKNNISDYLNLPIVLTETQAQKAAEVNLYDLWLSQNLFKFKLPFKYAYLEVGDLIKINNYTIKIQKLILGANFEIEVEGVSIEPDLYNINRYSGSNISRNINNVSSDTLFCYFELPFITSLEEKFKIYFAACSLENNWKGVKIFDCNYNYLHKISNQAVMGKVLSSGRNLEIILINGEIENTAYSQQAYINGNIIEFSEVQIIDNFHYRISNFNFIHFENKIEPLNQFILLDNNIQAIEVNDFSSFPTEIIIASPGQDLLTSESQEIKLNYSALKAKTPIVLNKVIINHIITLHILKCSRLPNSLKDNIDIVLTEENESLLFKLFYTNNYQEILSKEAKISFSAHNLEKVEVIQLSKTSINSEPLIILI